jgi:primosomal protein N'
MYRCEVCGYARQKPGTCPFCELTLVDYDREAQREYQVDMEEAMRTMRELQWYI